MSANFNVIISIQTEGVENIETATAATNDLESSMTDAESSGGTMGSTMMGNVGTFTRVAGSVALVGGSMMMLSRYQMMVQMQGQMLEQRQNTLANAQMAYNEAVAKYGPNSDQAVKAYNRMESAQISLSRAQERMNMLQMREYFSLLPMGLGIISSISSAYEALLPIIAARTVATDLLSKSLEEEAIAEAAVSGGLLAPEEVGAAAATSLGISAALAAVGAPMMQYGGIAAATRPYLLHAGERVINPSMSEFTTAPSAMGGGGGGAIGTVNITLDANAQQMLKILAVEYEFENQRRSPWQYGT